MTTPWNPGRTDVLSGHPLGLWQPQQQHGTQVFSSLGDQKGIGEECECGSGVREDTGIERFIQFLESPNQETKINQFGLDSIMIPMLQKIQQKRKRTL